MSKLEKFKKLLKFIISNSIIGPLLTLILVTILFIIFRTEAFLTFNNLSNILLLVSPLILLSLGSTLVLLIGCIDLSMEGIMALSSVAVGFLLKNPNNNNNFGFFTIPIICLLGAALGFINGFLHNKLKIPSLVVTLGMWFITLGTAVIIIKGIPIPLLDERIQYFSTGKLFGIPFIFIFVVAIFLLLFLIERRSRLGRYIFAIGGNEVLAKQLGIKVEKIKLVVFAIAGMLYALAGFINSTRLASADDKISNGFLFQAITAAIVGGTALTGGYGGSFNALIGAFIIIILKDGMYLKGIDVYYQGMVYGFVLIFAVALTIDRKKMPSIK